MIYDGFDFRSLIKVEDVHRPTMPPVLLNTKDTPGQDGDVIQGVTLEPKTIEVDIRLIAGVHGLPNQKFGIKDLRRKLSWQLFRRQPCKLVLHDEPDIYEMAILDGSTDLEAFCYTRFTTLTWHCECASYGKTRTKSSNGGTVSTYVNGTYRTAPVVMVKANGAFTIQFDGQPFEVTENVKGNVIINAEDHSITCDGERVEISYFAKYPTWEPGIHKVTCNLPYTVKFRERWL